MQVWDPLTLVGLGEEEIKSTGYGKAEADIYCWVGLKKDFVILFNPQSLESKAEPSWPRNEVEWGTGTEIRG